MGGFVSPDGDVTLSLENIEELVVRNEIEYPIASRDDLNDKSKGDPVTKTLVVLQTTWFLLQCAARGARGLALTELELATAAFALLNIITYAIWWDKPLDVQRPIKVRRTHALEQGAVEDPAVTSRAVAAHSGDATSWSWRNGVKSVIGPFNSMFRYGAGDDTVFVVGEMMDDWGPFSVYGAVLITLVFGGIHCVGWSFHFPSHTEQLLWRITSIAITGIPLAFSCMGWINECVTIPTSAIASLLVLYVFSRVVLLVLSVITLRSLSPSALQTVEWTTFLPHI